MFGFTCVTDFCSCFLLLLLLTFEEPEKPVLKKLVMSYRFKKTNVWLTDVQT